MKEGERIRKFFDGFGFSHNVLYDQSIVKIKGNADLTLAIRTHILTEFSSLFQFHFEGAELPSAYHFHTQFAAFNPWAVDRAAKWENPNEQGCALFQYIAEAIDVSQSKSMCRDLARYFAMHARVMNNYPSMMPVGVSGGDVWEKFFLQKAAELDGCVTSLTEAKNAVAAVVREMYPVFVEQQERDLAEVAERLNKYKRIYWRGNGERKFHSLLLGYPRFYGASPKVLDDLLAMSSYGLDPFLILSMAKIFGKRWRNYVCRYARDNATRHAILHEKWTQEDREQFKHFSWRNQEQGGGLDGVGVGVSEAIHDAGFWLSELNLPLKEGHRLADYLIKHDFARNRPHVRIVGRAWSSLTEEQKAQNPHEVAGELVKRLEELTAEMFAQLHPALREEVKKWIPVQATESEMELETWGKFISQASEAFVQAAGTSRPSWANFEVVDGEYKARWLPREDPRGLFIGHYTDCCQYIHGGGGASCCAIHSCTSPNGALLVIERGGKIVGQSWVWEGSDGRACFDNVEVLRSERNPEVFERIVRQVAEGLPHRMVTAGTSHTHAPFRGEKRHKGGKQYLPADYPADGYTDAETFVVVKELQRAEVDEDSAVPLPASAGIHLVEV